MSRPYNFKFKNLEAVTVKELNKKLDEIETKDIYHVIDDSNLTIYRIGEIMGRHGISWPAGIRISKLMCENLSYTPYFYHETSDQKTKYNEFIQSLCQNKQ